MDRTDSSPRVAGRISSGILRECTRFERTLRRGTAKLRGEIARLRGRGWRLHHCRGGLPLVRHHGLPIEFAREVGTRPWSASSLSATQPDNASRRITHRDETTGLTCGCAVRQRLRVRSLSRPSPALCSDPIDDRERKWVLISPVRRVLPDADRRDLEFRRAVESLRGRDLGYRGVPRRCHGEVILAWLASHPPESARSTA